MDNEIKISPEMSLKCLIKQCEKSQKAFWELSNIFSAYDDLISLKNGTATTEQKQRIMPAKLLVDAVDKDYILDLIKTIKESATAIADINDLTVWTEADNDK